MCPLNFPGSNSFGCWGRTPIGYNPNPPENEKNEPHLYPEDYNPNPPENEKNEPHLDPEYIKNRIKDKIIDAKKKVDDDITVGKGLTPDKIWNPPYYPVDIHPRQ